MKPSEVTTTFMSQRELMYRFFGRLFMLEADAKLLEDMKQMTFPEAKQDTDFAAGYELLKNYLAGHGEEDIINLEVDYAKVFLAAGVAQGLAAFPYESVYTNKKHLMSQEAHDDVTILYAAKGLEVREDMYRVPNDHISLEFEYMARLCAEAVKASASGDEAGLEESIREQEAFFNNHIKRWVLLFCNDVIKYADTDFYKAAAILCRGFVREEIELMA